jgi:hypothetical protein
MKKLLAVCFSLLFVLLLLSPASAAAATPAEQAHLHFNDKGEFRVMNLSDFQDDADFSSLTEAFIRKSVEEYKPDVIVLTGDNIAGYRCTNEAASEKAIRKFMDVLEDIGVPVAIVFGNHDDEGGAMSKERQMEIYSEYSVNISIDEAKYGQDLSGVGTYYVPIYESASSDKVKFVLWMFDSGSDDAVEDEYNYDHVHADQVEWFKRESARLNAENGETVYGIAFQHVVVNQIYSAFNESKATARGAVPYLGKWYTLPETASADSVLGEAPCPSYGDEGEFDAFRDSGCVLATVAGHDHANAYVIPYQGVDIICTPTCGFCSYGSRETRGGRIFDLSLGAPGTYKTYTYLFTDLDYAADVNVKYTFMNAIKEIYLFFNNLWVRIRESFHLG